RLPGVPRDVPEMLANMIADNPCSRQDQLVSICMALAEALRFTSATLDLWSKRDESSEPRTREQFHETIDALVENKGLNASAARWVKWNLRCRIPWTWLSTHAGHDDPRVRFLAEVSKQFSYCGDGEGLNVLSTAFHMFGRALKERR